MSLTNEQVAEKVRAIVTEELGTTEERLTDEARFMEDLSADSLDMVEVEMACEREFDIDIVDADFNAEVRTLGDLVTFIAKRV